ncbi:MAG: FHA domain-containing protein [Pseudomonadota bacterium]
MAYIKFAGDNKKIVYLREYHRIGRRAEAVDTQLDHPFVSKLHAIIEWKEPNWLIRDVSQNGIWINGEQLQPQTRHELQLSDLVEIAGSQGVHFEISDLAPPKNMLFNDEQIPDHVSLDDGVILPNEETPEFGVYKCPERLQWFVEQLHQQESRDPDSADIHEAMETGPYEHGDTLRCADITWRFFLVNEDDVTTEFHSEPPDIADVEFRFDISQNEENTTLTLLHNHQELDLGERSHHYLLAYLLRHKHAQAHSNRSLQKTEQSLGWMDCQLIEHELGIEESHLNIQIFRARKQILANLVGYSGSSKLIERRRGSVRMGIDNYSIYKEGVREV